ncbi:MAG: ParB N-terminal domain-containing protein, partial [Lachnospiraceae bacterium]|nr:ParB N-terminal domain-containing protein [Lachnospiraceae bacterium]
LKPYDKNPRMNEGGVNAVAESIKQFGFRVPIVCDKNYVIICGHTRLKAAQKIGLDRVPVIVADDLTEEQAKAFRIADNRTSDLSIWDNKLLLEELEALAGIDVFTGFDFNNIEELSILDEADSSALDESEYGVAYELVCRSMDKEKIGKIKKAWEDMGGDD